MPISDRAPLTELKYGQLVRRYERVKLVVTAITLAIVLAIGINLTFLARDNKASLTILRCAVSHEVQLDSHGKLRTQEESRKAFDRCVKNGGPTNQTGGK